MLTKRIKARAAARRGWRGSQAAKNCRAPTDAPTDASTGFGSPSGAPGWARLGAGNSCQSWANPTNSGSRTRGSNLWMFRSATPVPSRNSVTWWAPPSTMSPIPSRVNQKP